jgi:hypothetical protein
MWVWASALIAGLMTAYTSSIGNANSAVGLAPALMVSGLFLAWALVAIARPEARDVAPSRHERPPRLAFAALIGIVAVTIGMQFEFQQRAVPYSALTSRFDSGPWWGIKVTPERRAQMDSFAQGLRATSRPGDRLLVIFEAPGYYLYWRGAVASEGYWLTPGPKGGLPPGEIAYFREKDVVPSLVARVMPTAGLTPAAIAAGSAELGYPAVLVRPTYVIYRKPAGQTTAEVLARLPR